MIRQSVGQFVFKFNLILIVFWGASIGCYESDKRSHICQGWSWDTIGHFEKSLSAIKTENDGLKFLDSLEGECSINVNSTTGSSMMELLMRKFIVQNWFSNIEYLLESSIPLLSKTRGDKLDKLIDILVPGATHLLEKRPIPTTRLRNFHNAILKEFAQHFADHPPPKSWQRWVVNSLDFFDMTGQLSILHNVLSKTQVPLSQINKWQRSVVQIKCGFFESQGKFKNCESLQADLMRSTPPHNSYECSFCTIDLGIQQALTLNRAGKPADALRKLTSLLSDDKAVHAKPWIESNISYIHLSRGRVDKARTYLEPHFMMIKSLDLDQYHSLMRNLYWRWVHVSLLRESGKYQEALTEATSLHLDIERVTEGSITLTTWVNLELLMLAIMQEDQLSARKAMNLISESVAGAPDIKYVMALARAINTATLNARPFNLEPVQHLMGAKHPSLLQVERFLYHAKK